MQRGIRIGVALVGTLFTLQALGWIVDPATAADGLGMPLLEGLARSSQIGDTGALFLGLGVLCLLGAVTMQPQWLKAAALLLGGAAALRFVAFAFHDAAFATQFIAIEVVLSVALLAASSRLAPGSSA